MDHSSHVEKVTIFAEFQSSIGNSTKFDEEKLCSLYPELFEKDSYCVRPSTLEEFLTCDVPLPCSIHDHIRRVYKSKTPNEVAAEFDALSDLLWDPNLSNDTFSKLLAFTSVLLDCCGDIFLHEKNLKLFERLRNLHEAIRNLFDIQQLFSQQLSLIKNKSKFIGTLDQAHSDYYVKEIALEKVKDLN